jgi:hypothetical protein
MRRRRGEFKRPVLAVAETEHGIIVRLEEALCHSAGEEPRRVIVTAVPDVTDAEIVETLRALADQIGAA